MFKTVISVQRLAMQTLHRSLIFLDTEEQVAQDVLALQSCGHQLTDAYPHKQKTQTLSLPYVHTHTHGCITILVGTLHRLLYLIYDIFYPLTLNSNLIITQTCKD